MWYIGLLHSDDGGWKPFAWFKLKQIFWLVNLKNFLNSAYSIFEDAFTSQYLLLTENKI